jgi:hypothetical protein
MKSIHQYIKNKKGQLIGVVCAINKHQVGWSKCRTTSGLNKRPDEFDKQRGLDIAMGRAKLNPISTVDQLVAAPQSIRPIVAYMLARSERYFKNQ